MREGRVGQARGRRAVIVGAVVAAVGLLSVEAVAQQRGDSADDLPRACCGERDCLRARVAVVQQGDRTSTLDIDGAVVTVPNEKVHTSPNASAWYCKYNVRQPTSAENIRCAFVLPRVARRGVIAYHT